MKIYMVIADNKILGEGWNRWNVRAYDSKEAAQNFADEMYAELIKVWRMTEEVEEKELTEDERKKYDEAKKFLEYYEEILDGGRFEVEEYELYS